MENSIKEFANQIISIHRRGVGTCNIVIRSTIGTIKSRIGSGLHIKMP